MTTLEKLVANPASWAAIGAENRAFAEAHLDAARQGIALARIYDELLEESAASRDAHARGAERGGAR